MQLPDFLNDDALNELRAQMGTKDLGTFRLSVNPYRFTVRELEQLILEGMEIRYLDEVRALPDGTLCFKDRRVLLYLRELRPGQPLPVYHFSNCAVVREMREQPGFSRQAVCAREDGQFQLALQDGTQPQDALRRLPACEACLTELGFDAVAATFTVPRFFEKYRRNLVSVQPDSADTGSLPRP